LNSSLAFLNEAHQHEHDDQIASASLTAEQPMSPDRFVPWIEFVVQRFGSDILRMKGIVAMKGDDQRFVIQGVHMLVEGTHQRPWKPVGRNLPRLLLQEGFKACRA
jgi:G3E family GTPase